MLIENSSDFLFIYGTLLQRSKSPIALFLKEKSTIISEGSFSGILYDIGEYPGAIYIPEAETNVFGTVVRLLDFQNTIKRLDSYEETGPDFDQPNEYIRKIIPIKIDSGTKIDCWTYIYNHSTENKKQIRSGKYFQG